MHAQEKDALLSQMEHVTQAKPSWENEMGKKMKEMVAKSMASQKEIDSLKTQKSELLKVKGKP